MMTEQDTGWGGGQKPPSGMPAWGPTTKLVVSVLLLVAAGYGLYRFSPLLPLFALTGIFSYLMLPLVRLIERVTRLSRMWAVVLLYLLLLLLIVLAPILIVPPVVEQVQALELDLEGLLAQIGQFLARPIEILGYTFSLEPLYTQLLGTVGGLVSMWVPRTFSLVMGVAEGVAEAIFVLVISFYLLKDGQAIGAWFEGLVPPPYRYEYRELKRRIREVWDAFFLAQIIQCLVIAVLVTLVMAALGVRAAPILGLVAGVLEVVPTVGHTLSGATGVLFAYFAGSSYLNIPRPWFALLIAGVYTLIAQVDTNYIMPRIIGRRIHLLPIVVILGVLAGASLAGVLGVFLAAPVLATARVLGRYVYCKLFDLPPFPVPADGLGVLGGRPIVAVLFDLDGTLAETDDAAVERVAARLGGLARVMGGDAKRWARWLVMRAEGPVNAMTTWLDRVGLDDEVFRLQARVQKAQGESPMAGIVPMDGAAELLECLHRRYMLALVTTRPHEEAAAFLERWGLRDHLDVVVGGDDTRRLKPHPEPILKAARMLGVDPSLCLMVGDTPVDMRAARLAGAIGVGVLCGLGEREELERAGAEWVVEHTRELASVLVRGE